MVKICKISQLDQIKTPLKRCLVDTNILFALNNPREKFHRDAKMSFEFLRKKKISVYTNMNIKSEFIDLFRKLIIPKHLIGLYENRRDLDLEVKDKLKSLKSDVEKSEKKLKTFKLSDHEIKKWQRLLSKISNYKGGKSKDAWEEFCSDYLSGALSEVWSQTKEQWNMTLLSPTDNHDYFDRVPEWDDMILFVEKFGIGSFDAMILNFFLCSKIPLLITADKHMLYTIKKSNLFENKIIGVPDTLT